MVCCSLYKNVYLVIHIHPLLQFLPSVARHELLKLSLSDFLRSLLRRCISEFKSAQLVSDTFNDYLSDCVKLFLSHLLLFCLHQPHQLHILHMT